MVVDPNRREVSSEPQKSNKALIISISLHLVVFLLIVFGLPHFKTEPILSEPVPIELVADIGEMTTTNKKPVDAPKPKEEKPPEPPKKVETPKPPEPKKSAPEPPAEEKLKDPPKPDKPVEKVDDKAEKKIEKKPEPKKEKPKKTEQNDFDSLLKDLSPDKSQPDTDETAKKMTEPSPAPNVSKFADNLSISEMDALRQQLSQCWNVMAGGVNAEDQVVELSVTVNEAMTVEKAEVVDQSKYNSNAFFRAAADSAKRALRNPLCTPLRLPPNKYSQWHKMTLVFDPKEMF